MQGTPSLRRVSLQLVKKILTSWWTREQAPPPLPPLPVFAEILRISGRENRKERIFALGNEISRRKNPPVPAVHAAGYDKIERVAALSSSPGVFDRLRRRTSVQRRFFMYVGLRFP